MSKPKEPGILALLGQEEAKSAKGAPESVFKPQAVYFDTNTLRGARWPKGNAQLQQIMQYAEWLGIRLCLPEVVQQELEGQWVRKVQNQWQNTNSDIANLSGMLKPLREINGLVNPPTRDELIKQCRQDSLALTEKMVLVPLTKRPLCDFVKMAIFRDAAFSDSGRGFRDSVILCSTLEHMVAANYATGILVSEDEDFQKADLTRLAGPSRVELRILRNLDELGSLLEQNKNATIRKFVEREYGQLMDALNQRLPDLEKYIVENLAVAPGDLHVVGTVKKIESLQVVGIENAHEGFFWNEGQPTETNRVPVSADVKIKLTLDVERYQLPQSARLKVGGEVAPATGLGSDFFSLLAELGAKFHDAIAVVEGTARKDDHGYSDIRFSSTYLKRSDWGFGRYGTLLAGLT